MANPSVLLLDTDCLVQLFLADELKPLKVLSRNYGVQPFIVKEVDVELRWAGRHKDRFVNQLDKAQRTSVLKVMEEATFQSMVSTAPPGASWAQFQSVGAQYEGHVQRGEAYTHAAGLTLAMPVVSNDMSAISTLNAQGLPLPEPVLRLFDLIVFCYQIGAMNDHECDAVRKALSVENEGVSRAFTN